MERGEFKEYQQGPSKGNLRRANETEAGGGKQEWDLDSERREFLAKNEEKTLK